MSGSGGVGLSAPAWPAVPRSAWSIAWVSLVGQLPAFAASGWTPQEDWLPSSLLGVVLVVFVSHGVMRARMVRFWLVVVVLSLAAIASAVGLMVDPSISAALTLVIALAQLVLLREFSGTQWFELQRARQPGAPSLVPLMLIAVLVGVLAGMIGTETASPGVNLNVSF